MSDRGEQIRVLVVDDHWEMAAMIADDLRDRGYDAFAECSGGIAMRRLSSERIDVLVTDLRMPGVDGLALLRASRDLDPTRPVIMMTALAGLDTALEASEQGVYHYLRKPFRLDGLARIVESAVCSR